jgi:colicin import membrane protein
MKAHPRSAFGAQYSRQRRQLFGPSKPAQAGLEPRPSAPSKGAETCGSKPIFFERKGVIEMMKSLLVLAMLSLPLAALAQEDEAVTAQRARIAAERRQAEETFRGQEKSCHTKFAVNDCLNAAKAQRRALLADLRRQEISLNDAQRKRKAAEHLRSIEERTSADKQGSQAQERAKGVDEHREREATAARKAADRASADLSRPPRAAAQQEEVARKQAEASADQTRRAEEAARNVKKRNERMAQAQERKASREKTLAERRKPLADPLPEAPP